jgi:ADP-heptose:LPS heptosyltransferase
MKKLVLKCGLALGDIVMLTAAVRDLHYWYPGGFLTDVRTSCAELWVNNPHLSPLDDADAEVTRIDCSYPLINQCDSVPCHCLQGFVQFLNQHLDLAIKPTAFKGDIHLSPQEKAWFSQVHELTGEDTPFWIVAAGGKHDVTIKWWATDRYQAVVDHFRGKVQFVQVGQTGHHHPKLKGVIDLRGKTDLRQLIRLVYHAQGVLCGVTGLMHLAAAVETKSRQTTRPCVVVAGGREPAHWEAYPGHQFIHTNGSLPCCVTEGCWKDRTRRLKDGDRRDRADRLCLDLSNDLPRCMDLIKPAQVIDRIEFYFKGGVRSYLTARQLRAAGRGVRATAKNPYDRQSLNLHSAGLACDAFVQRLPASTVRYWGRGIVICGGGVRYFPGAWVCINLLRHLGCRLPIEMWYLGEGEVDDQIIALLKPLDVECIDACKMRRRRPTRLLGGWELKPYALLHSRFREVLLLDADNVPVTNPEYLFSTPEFRATGAVFWPDHDCERNSKAEAIWRSCGLRPPPEREFETGQILLDKQRCWPALRLSLWFNENSDFYYQYLHGDKETFHLAFRKLKQSYSLVPHPIHPLSGVMCQHDFQGHRIFQHRNLDKWDLFLHNRQIEGFWLERECREYVTQLHHLWDGGVGNLKRTPNQRFRCGTISNRPLRIAAVMISCAERDRTRQLTLENLAKTDWGTTPLHLQLDRGTGDDHQRRQTRCAHLALKAMRERSADFILFLEDDLDFNRHFLHNLHCWKALRERTCILASLFNPGIREVACDLPNTARLIRHTSVFGSQALLISRDILQYLITHWHQVPGMQDIKISRLAGRLSTPVFYHAPSLVEHTGETSMWGGRFHRARDFCPEWKADTRLH